MSTTVDSLLDSAKPELANISPTPGLDGEILLAHVLGIPRSQLLAHPEQIIPEDKLHLVTQLIMQRSSGLPVAYLTGQREFWSLPLKVTPATLIPRPDTELLVEQSLRQVPQVARSPILELGTGSGAVTLALAAERPSCTITSTDISEHALTVARENADALGIRNVEFLHGDWFAPVSSRRFRLIVSNPPYVAETDPRLQSADLRFEPMMALASGPDGLAAIRKIVHSSPDHLDQNGVLLLEHGQGQAASVRQLMETSGFRDVHSVHDLTGIERVCVGRLTG